MDYRKQYEKYAGRERQHAWVAIAGGVVNIAAGILLLKRLRDEQED